MLFEKGCNVFVMSLYERNYSVFFFSVISYLLKCKSVLNREKRVSFNLNLILYSNVFICVKYCTMALTFNPFNFPTKLINLRKVKNKRLS